MPSAIRSAQRVSAPAPAKAPAPTPAKVTTPVKTSIPTPTTPTKTTTSTPATWWRSINIWWVQYSESLINNAINSLVGKWMTQQQAMSNIANVIKGWWWSSIWLSTSKQNIPTQSVKNTSVWQISSPANTSIATQSKTWTTNALVNNQLWTWAITSSQIKNANIDKMRWGDWWILWTKLTSSTSPNDRMWQFKSSIDKATPATKDITNTPTDVRPEIKTPTDLRQQASNMPWWRTMELLWKTIDEATVNKSLNSYINQWMTRQQALQKIADDVKSWKLWTETSLYNLNNTLGKSQWWDITKERTDQMKIWQEWMNELAKWQNKPEEESFAKQNENFDKITEYKNNANDQLTQNITDRFWDVEKAKAEMLDKIKFMDTAKQQITMLQSNEALQWIMRQYMAQGMSEQEARNQAKADLGKQIMNERKWLLEAQVQTANAQKDIIQWATNANDLIRQAKENNIKYDTWLEKTIIDMKNQALQNRANVLSNTFANYVWAMWIKNFSDLNDVKKEQVLKMLDIDLANKDDAYNAMYYFNAIWPVFWSNPTKATQIYRQFRNWNFDLNTAVSTAKATGSTANTAGSTTNTPTNTSNVSNKTTPNTIKTSVGDVNNSF